MWGLLAGSFLAGLVGSPHCVGMCGGFAGACVRSTRHLGAYHLGRLGTYASLGALAGAFGHLIPGPSWVLTGVAGLLITWFALALAGLAPSPAPNLPGVSRLATAAARRGGMVGAWGLGAATALLPCGLVYAALGVPVSLAHPAWGALAMVLFGLGTVPLLSAAALGLQRVIAGRLWARRLLAVGVFVAGWWSILARHHAADLAPTVVEQADR